MRIEDMILVSVDDHVVEPATMFERHVPARYKDRAPRIVRKKDGSDVWVFEGASIPNIGLNAVVGRPPEDARPWARPIWEKPSISMAAAMT